MSLDESKSPAPAASEPGNGKFASKADFVKSFPRGTPSAEIADKAATYGINITKKYVSQVWAKEKERKKAGKPARKYSKRAAAPINTAAVRSYLAEQRATAAIAPIPSSATEMVAEVNIQAEVDEITKRLARVGLGYLTQILGAK